MAARPNLLFGVYLDPLRADEVIERCGAALKTRQRVLLGVVNAAKVVNLRKDPLLRSSLLECDLLLADGQAVVWASRLLGKPLPERVAGIDLFERLVELAHREGRSIYLLGAKPEVLDKLRRVLADRHAGLKIAGSHHGYFSAAEGDAIAEDIRRSKADMLFLGITSPKKETFLAKHGPTLGVPILHGVGGAFDVLAGVTRRAPIAWQRAGLEWAYRLLQEPRRLGWRYLSTNTEFIFLTLRELFRPSDAFEPRRRLA
jgi:N-acetylglucosaminyldiphosphoundecaprenol N-acetyl-beta-D-mannosaminyltransferase